MECTVRSRIGARLERTAEKPFARALWLRVSFIADEASAKNVTDGADNDEYAGCNQTRRLEWSGWTRPPEFGDGDADASPQ